MLRGPRHARRGSIGLLSGLARCGLCGGAVEHVGAVLTCLRWRHLRRQSRPVEAYVVAVAMTRLGLPDAQAILPRPHATLTFADPAYAFVGTSRGGMRAVVATFMDLTILPVGIAEPFGSDSVQVAWRTQPAEVGLSGRGSPQRPTEDWWDEMQNLGDACLFAAAEALVVGNPPPPLGDAQRRALWTALVPAAEGAVDAEVDDSPTKW